MSKKRQFQVAVVNETNLSVTGITFAAGQTESAVFNCEGVMPAQVYTPSNWTSCNLSFLVSKLQAGPFVPLTNVDGTSLAIATVASMCLPLQPVLFNAVLFMKLSCSVAQASALTVDMGLIPLFQGIHN